MIVVPTSVSTAPAPVARPLRRPSGFIDPVLDFGVVGDGVTDNGDALMAMRAYMSRHRETEFVINFPANGVYKYSNNHWLNGVIRVIVDGNGSTFQCTKSNEWGADSVLFNRHIYDDRGPDAQIDQGANDVLPCAQTRFATVAAGEQTITVLPAVSGQPYEPIENYSVGDKVFLWGYDQQNWAFPPNCRYYEWKEVAAVDVALGTITFTEPLVYEFRDDWKNNTIPGKNDLIFGAARLFRLHRDNYSYPDYIKLQNMRIVSNPNSTSGSQGIRLVADTFLLDNIQLVNETARNDVLQMFLGQNRLCVLRNSEFEEADIDKLGGELLVEDCKWKKFGPATGFQDVTLRNCEITKNIVAQARKTTIEDCKFYTAGSAKEAVWLKGTQHADEVILRNNTFFSGGYNYEINADCVRDITSQISDVIDGSTLVAPFVAGERQPLTRMIKAGSKIKQGTRAFTVLRTTWDEASSSYHIATDASDLTADMSFVAITVDKLTVENNQRERRKVSLSGFGYAVLMRNGVASQAFNNTNFFPMKVWAHVSNIRVDVLEPHLDLSTYDNPSIQIRVNGASGEIARFSVSAAAAGYVATDDAGDGAFETPFVADSYVESVDVVCWEQNTRGTKGFTGTQSEWPVFIVTISGVSICGKA